MGMGLPGGGHLTHGWKVSITGKYYNAVQYGVRKDDHRIDFDEVASLAREHKPKLLFCGATAYARTVDFPRFAEIAREVGAILVADIAHISGLVAGGAHPSPVGHAEVVSSTTHKTLRGPRGGMILCDEKHRKAIDKVGVPRPPRRSPQRHDRRHRHRRPSRRHRRLQGLRPRHRRQCAGHGRHAAVPGASPW